MARRDVPTFTLTDGAGNLRQRLGEWDVGMVVNQHNVLLGTVVLEDLADVDGKNAADVMREGPSTYRPNVSLEEMARKLEERRQRGRPLDRIIVTRSNGTLVGVARPEDVETT